jgi:uncharacterized OB-fold protein
MLSSPVKIWRNQKKIRSLLGISAVIETWTKVFVPPSGFIAQAPYVIVVVKGTNGKKYTGQLADFEDSHLHFGQKVRAILRRTREAEEESVIPYGIKFKPVQ